MRFLASSVQESSGTVAQQHKLCLRLLSKSGIALKLAIHAQSGSTIMHSGQTSQSTLFAKINHIKDDTVVTSAL